MAVNLQGIKVDFPFEPYSLQKEYMKRVIQCLQKGENGVLESPTGTGKTLCLLCSTLAWLEVRKAQIQNAQLMAANEKNVFHNELAEHLTNATGSDWANVSSSVYGTPKIIYTSRTHSQLTQVIKELKRTKYNYMKTSILGSRDQMCIHPQVIAETDSSVKIHLCRSKIKSRTCNFYNKLKNDSIPVNKIHHEKNVVDIEDLISLGQKEKVCPYFAARELISTADIIFMPYNYIFDVKFRKSQNIDIKGNIIIFDEGHNIEKVCEETSSCDLRSKDIANCIDEVDHIMRKLLGNGESDSQNELFPERSENENFSLKELALLKAMFCELEDSLQNISAPSNGALDGSFIFNMFEKVGLIPEKRLVVTKLIEGVIEYLNSSSQHGPFQKRGVGLQKFLEVIEVVFRSDVSPINLKISASKYYKTFLNEEQQQKQKNLDTWSSNKPLRILSFWCFNPGMSMKALQKEEPHSIIITSGTLHPINKYIAELQIPFPVFLENPHIIKGNQIWAGIITKGPDEKTLNSKFGNRTVEYMDSLGRTICNVLKMIPGGVLVFFPSYSVMKQCCERWEMTGTWQTIGKCKLPLVESQNKAEFQTSMQLYYDAIKDPTKTGAIFFGVCRGKVSEGLDFADMNGRAVIITGLPYAQFNDPRVRLKREYLNDEFKTNKLINKDTNGILGTEWYFLEAVRAVNQAIGRVIRHKDDYGAILLCDERFSANDIKDKMSTWVMQQTKRYDKFGEVIRSLKVFFQNAEKMFPQAGSTVSQDEIKSSLDTIEMVDKDNNLVEKNRSYFTNIVTKRPSTELDYSELQKTYLPETNEVLDQKEKLICSKKSCFEYFTDHKETLQNPIQSSSKSKTIIQITKENMCVEIPRKKRKIKIKPNDSNSDVEKDESRAQFFRIYLAKMKNSLKSSDYALFTATLKEYHANPAVWQKMSSLLINCLLDNIPLLQESRCLFIAKHKPLYDKLITDLIKVPEHQPN